MVKTNHITIVPETHWDREWYLPFQEFRAKLVRLMDNLLKYFYDDPEYTNFTLDGQTIPLEDYLEIKPEKKKVLKKYVKQKRLSIGPMYVLPDEFLISGESLIRNLIIGHQIAEKFGRVMKAGYLPDTFGHIAQMPQIFSGFEIPSIIFWRGFGDEFESNELNLEFLWQAPGNPSHVVGIFLIFGYMSAANLNISREDGVYRRALNTIKNLVSMLEVHAATPYLLLNNGVDHAEAQREIPEIVKQWNKQNPTITMVQNDFEHYIDNVIHSNVKLKTFQGELRGGRYAPILSGVLSTRMWIKQRNTKIECLYEKYCEPISTMIWALERENKFEYPQNFIRAGWKWLMKNHPHDSISGCCTDQVHDEMKTRFDWAEQIGNEIIKNSILYASSKIRFDLRNKNYIPLIIYNPLPWYRTDVVNFDVLVLKSKASDISRLNFKLIDCKGKNIEFSHQDSELESIYRQENYLSHKISFLAETPACGYNTFYIIKNDFYEESLISDSVLKMDETGLENEFYQIKIEKNGTITIFDKKSGISHKNSCTFRDVGDWGDEYDFSGPLKNQVDKEFSSLDGERVEITPHVDGPSIKVIRVKMLLKLPISLSVDRLQREEKLVDNEITLFISLYKGIKRIDFKIILNNQSKDHRIQVMFPSRIKSERVFCDGHFYVVPRNVVLPSGHGWIQKPLPTNHQKDFVVVDDGSQSFAVLNKGLPEYEAIRNNDDSIILVITLLRCIGLLSRRKISSRSVEAGPYFETPKAQCIGKHEFDLSLIIEHGKTSWIESEIHLKGKEFNNPLMPLIPSMIEHRLRSLNTLSLTAKSFVQSDQDLYLPQELSFLEIDNRKVMMSILKKAENGNELIMRCYNISSEPEIANISFCKQILIKNAFIVNFLENPPIHEIKGRILEFEKHIIKIHVEPHVIATISIHFIRNI